MGKICLVEGCPGCSCHVAPPCSHCVEHCCACGDEECDGESCKKELKNETFDKHRQFIRAVGAMALLSTIPCVDILPDIPYIRSHKRRTDKTKQRNIERNRKAQKAARRRK